ncbi:hypothetical protein PUP68_00295 [Pseudomonas chlororaphis]|uniref:hypothetical protein n=1 Tax=Pseudomonas chlororaphis TaxID=587753 RepID=UPI002368E46D|nr:hypothetical protein [Pseudomonas chlororaphis]WDG81378.1 hypothetical protein PUP77_11945 [Pseudomonas chlororaphis]WDG85569.1 hypothetical protein PUP68_00295 [Pseudomonas chlororaphis]
MKSIFSILFIFFSFVGFSWGDSGLWFPEISHLPVTIEKIIAKENEVDLKDVHQFPNGTLKWEGGYISAIAFDGSTKSCAVYISNSGSLSLLFSGASCEFSGSPKVEILRKASMPDVLYKVKLFLPNRGAMVDEILAFYFDDERKTYCESQLLGDWYETGNRSIEPNISDGKCE